MIYFPKCPSFPIIQGCAPNIDVEVRGKKGSNWRRWSPQNNQMGPCYLPELPQAINYLYGRHKKKSPQLHGSHMKWVTQHTRTSDHGSQDILSIGDVAYKSEITQNFVLIN